MSSTKPIACLGCFRNEQSVGFTFDRPMTNEELKSLHELVRVWSQMLSGEIQDAVFPLVVNPTLN